MVVCGHVSCRYPHGRGGSGRGYRRRAAIAAGPPDGVDGEQPHRQTDAGEDPGRTDQRGQGPRPGPPGRQGDGRHPMSEAQGGGPTSQYGRRGAYGGGIGTGRCRADGYEPDRDHAVDHSNDQESNCPQPEQHQDPDRGPRRPREHPLWRRQRAPAAGTEAGTGGQAPEATDRAGQAPVHRAHDERRSTMAKKSSSLKTGTSRRRALSSLEPGDSPATT